MGEQSERKIHSIEEFALYVQTGLAKTDACFVEAIGMSELAMTQLLAMDREKGSCSTEIYIRIKELSQISKEQVDTYTAYYEIWQKGGYLDFCSGKFEKTSKIAKVAGTAFQRTIEQLEKLQKGVKLTPSIQKNIGIKFIYWLDSLFANTDFSGKEKTEVRIIAENIVKKHEYFFFYFLTQLGIDVLLLQNSPNRKEEFDALQLSQKIVLGEAGSYLIPEYQSPIVVQRENMQADCQTQSDSIRQQDKQPESRPRLKIPRHPNRNTTEAVQTRNQMPLRNQNQSSVEEKINRVSEENQNIVRTIGAQERGEKSFEELALLASSVVMITVYDKEGEACATGSGIMIGEKGFILTNHHVVARGVFFTVQIEEDQEVYETDEVIKYNYVMDLAVLRIQRSLKPLPIYNGPKKLVRGQKVVAIGSPLGLFNSVSDGIISGFRKIRDVDMIQFTAPISSGSSGGAVLNMYGEIIGISTAGIDEGQNINLAVKYEDIRTFARGFF